MILLTLLCLCLNSRILAIPLTGHPPLLPAVYNFQSNLIRDNIPPKTRTIWNIIWSCFSTLFACAWIAVHPNIPAPGDSPWKIFRRRMMIMVYVLLLPEMVIVWAARQHHDAKALAEEFQHNGPPGWAKTHAFFLIMGGFTLHEQGKPIRVLNWRDLNALARARKVYWPDITEEEIKDRSKGDYLSKGIVVLQTTWFIIQFIARAASSLAITELEVVTLAFSTLIGVIYYLWWDKPLDVRCSVAVHLVEHSTRWAISDNATDNNPFPVNHCLRDPLPKEVPIFLDGASEVAFKGNQVSDQPLMPSLPNFSEFSDASQNNFKFNSIPTTIKDLPSPPQTDSPRGSTSSVSWMKRLHFLIQNSCQERGTLAGLIHVVFMKPIYFLLTVQLIAMVTECTIETDGPGPNDRTDPLLRNGPLSVPTFYSSSTDGFGARFVFGVCLSILFGVIHCMAWYYEFPSSPERWGWRISAVIVSTVPLAALSLFMMCRMGIVKEDSIIFVTFCNGFGCLYTASRIALLVLPLIALRALPPDVYVDLNWATIIPHI